MTTGERIREKRKSKGITLAQLAERVGVTASAISQYERGKLDPTRAVSFKIAIALECRLEDILSSEDIARYGITTNENNNYTSALISQQEFRSIIIKSETHVLDLVESLSIPATFLTSVTGIIRNDDSFDILSVDHDFRGGPFHIIGEEAAALLSVYMRLNADGRIRLIEHAYDLLEVSKYKET